MKKKEVQRAVGVRFLRDLNIHRIYTYRVKKMGAFIHLGQELIAPTPLGNSVCVVVLIHENWKDDGAHDYKFITQKVGPL